ncbi:MAG: sulfatase-like hydrolase/transferase [Bryobacterales bacterium]|nr:sulfatase-like hydrolase/transferase [Bryobacterales bacterium]
MRFLPHALRASPSASGSAAAIRMFPGIGERSLRRGWMPWPVRIPGHLPDSPAVREDMLGYYAEVEQFDFECGQMIETLRARGELENTLVVMTSDNGWQLPRGLANCYDLGVASRWRCGFLNAFDRARSGRDFVTLFDLAPTFWRPQDCAASVSMDGHSLFGRQRRDAVFLERNVTPTSAGET